MNDARALLLSHKVSCDLYDQRRARAFLDKIPPEALETIAREYRRGGHFTMGITRPGEPEPVMVQVWERKVFGEASLEYWKDKGWKLVKQSGATSTGMPIYLIRFPE